MSTVSTAAVDAAPATRSGPLVGYRVLELGSTVAGPFCGRMLADFGAEVIKVEPESGDPVRTMGKRFEGKSLYASSIFRNKRLISLNLRRREGQEIARELARKCDVVIENFRPGTLEKWGLGYESLASDNPRIVMVRISGYGQTGPYSGRPGYGVIGEAISGLRHLTGDPDRPPARVAVSLTDYITGLYGAFGAVMALFAREKTGRGQFIDAALYECAFSFMEPWIASFEKLGHVPGRVGPRLPESTPNNLYPTADDQYIHITAMGDALFRRLATAMEQPELPTDPRFAGATLRSEHHEAIDALIGEWTQRHTLASLEEILARHDVPATRIFTIADIFADPHYRARQSIVAAPDDDWGSVTMAAVVPRLSDTPGAVVHSGHRIGQDTRDVLAELLGYGSERIDALSAAGIVQCGAATGDRDPELAESSAGGA